MANPKYEEFSLTFEKGLTTEVEDSSITEGQAAELLNWEPTAQGGLRPRNAWGAVSTTGLTSPYKVRGWGNAPVGSGGGYVTPTIVQEVASAGGAESGNESDGSPKTATLNGCTAGNILIGLVTSDDSSPDVTLSAGWTVRVTQAGSGNCVIKIATKTSVGGTETITATQGSSLIHHVHLLEVSGLSAETPTDTDSVTFSNGTPGTLSCTSVTNTGFAVSIGIASSSDWVSPPSLTSQTVQFNVFEPVSGSNSEGVTAIYSSSPITDTQENSSFSVSAGGMAIWDAATQAATPANFYILVAVATSTGYSIYRILRDAITSGTWELVDSAAVSDNSAYVSMSVGAGKLVWTASTMTNPRVVTMNTLVAADVTDLSSKSGRATAYHKDRMFVGGSSGSPARLYFSAIGDPDTFTTATDFLDIGGDDGEAIEDLVSVEGLLLVCKVNRLYLVSGSGVETFFVNELPGGSASTGRPAVRTPYGTIVAGPADVWVVQGGGVDPMSRPLGVDYSISGLVSTAYAQDIVLISDSGTGVVFRVNLVTGAWSKEEVTAGENQVAHLFSLQGRLYYGVSSSTSQLGGTRRLSSSRGYDLTNAIEYTATTGKTMTKGPSVRYTPQYLFLQTRLEDVLLPSTLSFEVITNQGTTEHAVTVNTEVQRDRVGIGVAKGVEWIQVRFLAGASPLHAAIGVEKVILGAIPELQ